MTKKIKLGSLSIDAVQYGSQGNAVLGIRDSGKTYTATYFAECLFDAGVPFIAFDPIGVWRFLRVPGKGRGYPIVVAGGKEGDLPLTEAGAPEIVRAAMRNGVSLVIDLFDINLSKAAWRRIVTSCVRVLLHENAQYGLRHVFLEEAAEFIPQKPNDWDVYNEIEKLARMGGNSRLGYTLINQRSQEVAKAILELCENLFLHRQRGKNALENMDKWLQIAGASEQKEIVKSLPELPQGTCWGWLGGDNPTPPTLAKVPEKNSFHPDRRIMHGDKLVKGRKAVDVGDFVAGMKTTLVKVEEEDKANNPKLLRAEIARLNKVISEAAKAKGSATIDPAAIAKAEERSFERGKKEVAAAADKRIREARLTELEGLRNLVAPLLGFLDGQIKAAKADKAKIRDHVAFTPAAVRPDAPAAPASRPVRAPAAPRSVTPSGDDSDRPLKAERKPLAALASAYPAGMTEAQWAVAAGLKRTGGTWGTYLSRLRMAGRIVEQGDTFFATEQGIADLGGDIPQLPPPGPQLVEFWAGKITGASKMLRYLAGVYPNFITRDELAAGLEPPLTVTGGTFGTYLSRLRAPGLIEEQGDQLRAAPQLMEAA